MIIPGTINNLQAVRETSVGFFLTDAEGNEVLLPKKYCSGLNENEHIDVFIYFDSEDRPVATTETPLLQLDGFACLEVKSTGKFGAFLNWGLEKDLLLPFAQQQQPVEPGDWVVVTLKHDDKTNRLYASSKIRFYLDKNTGNFKKGDTVDVFIWDESQLGIKVIVNNRFEGLIFFKDLFKEVAQGETYQGYVANNREDGKLTIRLGLQGLKNIEPSAQFILKKLESAGGFLPFNDESAPEAIMATFGMSKKAFKKAVGNLYKSKLIELKAQGIQLMKK